MRAVNNTIDGYLTGLQNIFLWIQNVRYDVSKCSVMYLFFFQKRQKLKRKY